ncbi:hypothetical protein B0H13DRAFT_2347395 [Mycena leptocephala]|nr:hypothetical protein B0H13DRAFT_2347395 [Mycena leptocephala]
MVSHSPNPNPPPSPPSPIATSTPPASSLDTSLLSHGDLSNFSTEFFHNVPGLEAPPVDLAAALQIPKLPMPAWSYMPTDLTAEEQAEVNEDPFADYNDNDTYAVDYDADSNNPLSVEEDELTESPGPVHESPVPQPSWRRKRALSLQGSIQPLRYPPPTAEEQIGGENPQTHKWQHVQVNKSGDQQRERQVDESVANLNWARFKSTNPPPPPLPLSTFINPFTTSAGPSAGFTPPPEPSAGFCAPFHQYLLVLATTCWTFGRTLVVPTT